MFDWVHDLHILSIVAYIPLLGGLAIVLFMRRANDVAVRNFATAVATLRTARSDDRCMKKRMASAPTNGM